MTKGVKDSSGLYEVERRAYHAARPGFRIAELQISPTQKVPWHYHNNVHDTFYVLEGTIQVFLQQPKEEVRLSRGQTFSVPPEAPAPRHQCRRHVRGISRAAGNRRVRFRAAHLRHSDHSVSRSTSVCGTPTTSQRDPVRSGIGGRPADICSMRVLRILTDTVDKVRNRLGEVPEHLLTVIFSLGLAAPVAASSCTVPQGLP